MCLAIICILIPKCDFLHFSLSRLVTNKYTQLRKHAPDMKTSLAGRQQWHKRSCWSQDQQQEKNYTYIAAPVVCKNECGGNK
jgi:hypothetical protein